ncbi:hypothetical protein FM076_20135 [Streptomyces albus subsp. chlorinus]|uniref:hypothetical protein n=1 Tax=Streptomyces albus TaxID=1888 RepID=UPI00156FE3F7|nr:hypothetical protein [Streptomyces albus]NSC23331.1 hypothetical protein [Streptomyces albus subsp. chlorinus]
MRKTRMAAVAAGAALIAGLTACGSEKADGGGDDAKGGGSPVQGALAALKKASTATDKQNSAVADGVQTMTLEGKPVTSKMKGSFDWSSGGMQGQADITTNGTPTEARYLSDAMYSKMAQPVQGKQWLKVDYEAMAKKNATGALLKDQLQNNNPARSVQLLLASGKVKSAGTETVRGQKATRYTGTLTLSELVRMQSKDLKESEKQALEQQFKQNGMESEKIDLWIGEGDLLVKKCEVAKGTKSSTENTVYYSDYGTKVDVSPPPASQTLDSTELGSGAGGLG